MNSEFPESWIIAPLEECMESVIDYRGKTPQKTTFGIPLITAKIVKGGRINDVQEYIATQDYNSWMRRGIPKAGDVLVTTEAPLGEVAQLDNRKVALAQRLITLRGKKDYLDNGYLKFLMLSDWVQNQLNLRATGTTVLGIKQSELRKVELVVPPLAEQKAIAHILGTLDDKIELNQRMNRTLESIARAIFKSWFIDFDPVRAKMEGRQPEGMSKKVADLFPDSFVDSELGMIPKGWEVARLRDHVQITKGKSYKSKELSPCSTALITLKSFQRGGGYRTDGLKPYTGTYKPEQVVKIGELVVAFTDVTQAADVIGKPAIVKSNFKYETLVASLDVGIVRTISQINIPFLYYLFLQEEFQSHIYAHTNGSTVLHLSKEAIPTFEFCLPPTNILDFFHKLLKPFFLQIDINDHQCTKLNTIRDTLLPKLISGEIRVNTREI